MGSGRKASPLGRSIIRERRGVASSDEKGVMQLALEDGPSWTRLRSVTDQTDLEELLAVAELAGSEFTAERTTSNMVNGEQDGSQILQRSLARLSVEDEAEAKGWLRIPRRPKWDSSTTAVQLRQQEQADFLTWRRRIAELEEQQQRHQLSQARGQVLNTVTSNVTGASSLVRFILTPFERNLDIWRQLWRVVEQSSLLVQIVDARNPLLFFCSDLFDYAREQDPSKRLLLLLNKADLLTEMQRLKWSEYFAGLGIEHAFYSAFAEGQKLEADLEEEMVAEEVSSISAYALLSRSQLLTRLHRLVAGGAVGMVGYPNVGKSSTINSLVGQKRVAVAATPGKTKHFQTLSVDLSHLSLGMLNLCDCPGLVFPNFTATRADLVLNGILPIDQLREWLEPVALLVQRIPRGSLEQIYGVDLSTFDADGQPRSLGAHDLLAAHARKTGSKSNILLESRGFKTSMHGNPDEARSARIVLKDYVNVNHHVAD